MYYIYFNGLYVGTSETWVDLPEGYELTENPPPPPTPVEVVTLPDTAPVINKESFSDIEVNKLRSELDKLSPLLADLFELVLRNVLGDVDKCNKLVLKLKGAGDGR